MMTGTLEVTTPGDREIVMTRSFDAPSRLVFDAFTRPELVQRWLLGPPGGQMPVCEIDLRVGGTWRYRWKAHDGFEFEMSGEYRELVPPKRIVNTERYGGEESLVTTVFSEADGRTTVTMTCLYSSRDVRDRVIATGMTSGVESSFERLDELLTTMG